ncbi:hypothetical protein H0H93_007810 [Arthromyces matolae]|nr:hypothetical protein H0H93_007810 [Arthromyces matolae]
MAAVPSSSSTENLFRAVKAVLDANAARIQSSGSVTGDVETQRNQIIDILKSHGIFDGADVDKSLKIPGVNSFGIKVETPATLEEIQALVLHARKNELKVRVVGSARSFPSEIILGIDDPAKVILVSLTKYRGVTINANGVATVKAGTNFGLDPNNPDSTHENSLVKIIDDNGWALPITDLTLHDTVGGFLQAGYSGTSNKHGLDDAVVGFSLVTGTGEVKKLCRKDPDPSFFFAAGVSLGLFGIVTEVQIQLERSYFVRGSQKGYDVSIGGQNPPPLDIMGHSPALPDLRTFTSDNEYIHILWMPQRGVNRLQVWQGVRVPHDATLVIQSYQTRPMPLQLLARGVLAFVWHASLGSRKEYDNVIVSLLSSFIPLEEVPFTDKWYKAIALDDVVRAEILPTAIAGILVDPKDVTRAVILFNDLHNKEGGSTNNYPIRLYSVKKSDFWLSPSFSGDKIALDLYFNLYNTEPGNLSPPFKYYPPEKFFAKYWAALDAAKIRYHSHWGNYRQESHATVAYLKGHYSRYEEWLELRSKLDPDQVFVSPYWAKHLQIPSK